MKPYKVKQGILKRLQHGGRKSSLRLKWLKFTVMYSMKRFLRSGGGCLLLQSEEDGSTFLAVISKRSSLKPTKRCQPVFSKSQSEINQTSKFPKWRLQASQLVRKNTKQCRALFTLSHRRAN